MKGVPAPAPVPTPPSVPPPECQESRSKFTGMYLVGRLCVCARAHVCTIVHVRVRGRDVSSQTRVQGPTGSLGVFFPHWVLVDKAVTGRLHQGP